MTVLFAGCEDSELDILQRYHHDGYDPVPHPQRITVALVSRSRQAA